MTANFLADVVGICLLLACLYVKRDTRAVIFIILCLIYPQLLGLVFLWVAYTRR